MKGIPLILILLFSIATIRCSDCTNCQPFMEEPFLKIRFLRALDSTNQLIIIDSVNGQDIKQIKHFQDTTFEFKFPLNMHSDTSVYQLVYRDTADLNNYMNNRIELIYSRQFIRRDDNYIIVECNLEETTSDFNNFQLVCKDGEPDCISNEAKVKIYN